jgi:hypothetical protein
MDRRQIKLKSQSPQMPHGFAAGLVLWDAEIIIIYLNGKLIFLSVNIIITECLKRRENGTDNKYIHR